MCALIASLRPLMKHSLKNKSDWPYVVTPTNFRPITMWHTFSVALKDKFYLLGYCEGLWAH
jgi:hypothetical protein